MGDLLKVGDILIIVNFKPTFNVKLNASNVFWTVIALLVVLNIIFLWDVGLVKIRFH